MHSERLQDGTYSTPPSSLVTPMAKEQLPGQVLVLQQARAQDCFLGHRLVQLVPAQNLWLVIPLLEIAQ